MTAKRSLTIVPLLALPTLALGCADSDGAREAEPVQHVVQNLYVPDGAQKWYPQDVPMCWHEFVVDQGAAFTEAEKVAIKNFISTTVQENWGNLTQLRITWAECPTSGDAKHVRVKLERDATYNGLATLGMGGLTTAQQRAQSSDAPGYRLALRDSWNDNDWERAQFRRLIVHEFGHVLGFADEGLRYDSDFETCPGDIDVPGTSYWGPDAHSIMRLTASCGANWTLSANDVAAARYLYGYHGSRVSNDFNLDVRGDILWYNSTTLETQIWHMAGSSRVGRSTVLNSSGSPALIGGPYRIAGSRDFNGDSRTDLLWHNSSTGEMRIWYMNGARQTADVAVVNQNGQTSYVGHPFYIVGTADFNRDGFSDGYADILWHNVNTGETQIWYMYHNRHVASATVVRGSTPIYVGHPNRIVGIDDFNRDGRADILWHNETTGEIRVWHMNGPSQMADVAVLGENGQRVYIREPFRIASTNDFNNDGDADILWHNETTGESQIWYMNQNRVSRRATVDAAPDGNTGAFQVSPWAIMPH